MMPWTSSGSSRSDIAVKPETSENITVTVLRSPSIAPFDVRIFSARCLGVYAAGEASRKAEPGGAGAAVGGGAGAGGTAATSFAPHSPQNFRVASLGWPQLGHGRGSRAPHSPQNFVPGAFGCWHCGHVDNLRTSHTANETWQPREPRRPAVFRQ